MGVTTADQFGSPLQPDVRFRGFQVSPVVGASQSVSVFVDGVRVNEPDASQVNFNLIPLHAVERVEVIRTPGGPFGRNALAGSINLVTRSGRGGGPQGFVQASGASFETGRFEGWGTGGGEAGAFYTAAFRYWRQTGWRDLSASELVQGFGKVGYRWADAELWASYTLARDRIEGPGSLPESWLRGVLPPCR